MPDETVIYMRGTFPFASGRGVHPDLIRELKILLQLDQGQLAALAQELLSFGGFLDRPTLLTITKSFIPDDEQAKLLARLIFHINETLRKSASDLQRFFLDMEETLQREKEDGGDLLTAAEFDELRRRMKIVHLPYPGLNRQAKAQRLSEATGLRFETIELVCDLRPVFDEDRESVVGVIPYTILKLVCLGLDGLPIGMEAVLAQSEVEMLAKKSAAALKKLDRLRALLAAKDLPVPPVQMVKKGE